jgi:[protein-PII] uridylyltransferase
MRLTPPRWRSRRPPLLSRDHRVEVDDRCAVALRIVPPGGAIARRIRTAPPAYLLAHAPSDIVRQCELLEPLPAAGEVRTVLTPSRVSGAWHLDLATRDRSGLLAAFTGVLTAEGLDVAQAVVATWPDGAALQALMIRSERPPDPATLGAALAASLDHPVRAPAVPDARITFDQESSPIYTACRVEAADRPGLLHAVATAMTATRTDIHAAGVSTCDGRAVDRFDLTGPDGGKLDRRAQELIRVALRTGVGCGEAVPR